MEIPSQEFLKYFKSINGAFGVSEAVALYNIAKLIPIGNGAMIEFGTFRGKSALCAANGYKDLPLFYLVDPIFSDQEIHKEVEENLKWYCKPKLIADESLNVVDKYAPYKYVFIDSGSHSDDLPMCEVKAIEDKMVVNGIIAFHDLNNQFVRVREAYDYLLSTGKFEEIEVDWKPIFDYVRENNLEEGNNSWHERGSNEFPCYVGAVRCK